MICWWCSVHSYCWTCVVRGPLGAQGTVGCPLATTHVNHFLRGCVGVDLLGVDLLGVDLVWILFPPRNRQTAADVCIKQSTYCFTPQNPHQNKSPPNPPPAAQWPCHCCSCHLSLTCENDWVPSSMITAMRGRQREGVLLDVSQVQQNSNNMLGKQERTFTRNPLCKETGPTYALTCVALTVVRLSKHYLEPLPVSRAHATTRCYGPFAN